MKSAIKAQFVSLPSIIAATTFVALACIAHAGTAQASESPLTKKVVYQDLNLDSEPGAKALYARLLFAAKEVCTPYESIELSQRRIWQTCVDNAMASAVKEINKPMVTALYSQSFNPSHTG
jgi:UrcA family protein